MEATADNVIFVGEKPFMNYVSAVVIQFTMKDAQELTIKARGKYISRAVDIAEVAARQFLSNRIQAETVTIGSEDFVTEQGTPVRVSTIEILMKRIP